MPNNTFEPIVITDVDEAGIIEFIKNIADLLPDTLVTLTPKERMSLPKSSDKTFPFCEKSSDYAKLIPDIIPKAINVDNILLNKKAFEKMLNIKRALDKISVKLDDSILKSGSEMYLSSLSIYKAVKDGAIRNVDGCKDAEEELKKRFHYPKSKTDNPENPE